MARLLIALASLTLAAGCGAAPAPPIELDGLWSAGPAACSEDVGVRFTPDAIVAAYQDQQEILFAAPRYEVLGDEPFRVRIEYRLPHAGVRGVAGARGVLVLAQADDGALSTESHALLDGRTGAARMRLKDDPATTLLALEPCGPRRGRGVGLRGLTAR